VYGINTNTPWSEEDPQLFPISPYAASKRSGEILGSVYHHLYGIRFIALRLFTVYGPQQRPDLAIHKFANLLVRGLPIPIFGSGALERDYTFIDDIVAGITGAINYKDSGYEIFNLGNNHSAPLIDVVRMLEQVSGKTARIQWQACEPGDVPKTCADISKARNLLGYEPQVKLQTGISLFWRWFSNQLHGDNMVTHA
jgi:UDP-glucuronate 4-epimerase